ncbi:hypothetical protein PR048_005234 [Dryococelus australis]|uniref:Uncharacterized protein n=1 Tax=Dryococelus australis TaxID=614101 RepID=A0ABQ9I7M5_9NEOP|nr:hypothetical protein PR048_005234 [Dryococelus australis]
MHERVTLVSSIVTAAERGWGESRFTREYCLSKKRNTSSVTWFSFLQRHALNKVLPYTASPTTVAQILFSLFNFAIAIMAKATSGFVATGIHPHNPNIFTDEDFFTRRARTEWQVQSIKVPLHLLVLVTQIRSQDKGYQWDVRSWKTALIWLDDLGEGGGGGLGSLVRGTREHGRGGERVDVWQAGRGRRGTQSGGRRSPRYLRWEGASRHLVARYGALLRGAPITSFFATVSGGPLSAACHLAPEPRTGPADRPERAHLLADDSGTPWKGHFPYAGTQRLQQARYTTVKVPTPPPLTRSPEVEKTMLQQGRGTASTPRLPPIGRPDAPPTRRPQECHCVPASEARLPPLVRAVKRPISKSTSSESGSDHSGHGPPAIPIDVTVTSRVEVKARPPVCKRG